MSLLCLFACAPTPEKVGVGDEVGDTPSVDTDTDVVGPVVVDTDVVPGDTAPAPATAHTGDTDPALDTAGWRREIDVLLTVDDAWTLFLDGQPFTEVGSEQWSVASRVVQELPGRRHVVAVHGRDLARVISGFIAVVHVSTELYAVTGDGQWRMSTTPPPADWAEVDFDDSAWGAPVICPSTETATWGGRPADFAPFGAQWVWTGRCRDLGEAWFRLVIE